MSSTLIALSQLQLTEVLYIMLLLSLLSSMIGFVVGALSAFYYYKRISDNFNCSNLESTHRSTSSSTFVANNPCGSAGTLPLPPYCSTPGLPFFRSPSRLITPGVYLSTVVSDFENAGYVFIHEFSSIIWIHVDGIYRSGDRLMVIVCPQTCEVDLLRKDATDPAKEQLSRNFRK